MSSSLFLQQCFVCFVRLIWMELEVGVAGHTSVVLQDVASRICSI